MVSFWKITNRTVIIRPSQSNQPPKKIEGSKKGPEDTEKNQTAPKWTNIKKAVFDIKLIEYAAKTI